jgi:hypothetical protein
LSSSSSAAVSSLLSTLRAFNADLSCSGFIIL